MLSYLEVNFYIVLTYQDIQNINLYKLKNTSNNFYIMRKTRQKK
jgi:hypothetical protein